MEKSFCQCHPNKDGIGEVRDQIQIAFVRHCMKCYDIHKKGCKQLPLKGRFHWVACNPPEIKV